MSRSFLSHRNYWSVRTHLVSRKRFQSFSYIDLVRTRLSFSEQSKARRHWSLGWFNLWDTRVVHCLQSTRYSWWTSDSLHNWTDQSSFFSQMEFIHETLSWSILRKKRLKVKCFIRVNCIHSLRGSGWFSCRRGGRCESLRICFAFISHYKIKIASF